ncbi:unnamed protein product [Ceratitis capitata]|uniref:(Mediterranean fruit fly) hypothetical protein n=1 Tax=Ceratitis capitata TaxID=7213 RepID=A0A811U259_CERCA|nr:unnamed protein product [Ceratitis capitata]
MQQTNKKKYGRWVTRRVAVITIAAIWLLAAFVSFVPISLGLHRPEQPLIVEDNGKRYPTCALDLTPTYAVVSSCISFYFPCLVMIGIYCSPVQVPKYCLTLLCTDAGIDEIFVQTESATEKN